MANETVREKILANVCSELANIKIVNGYSTDLAEVRNGMFATASITNYPTAVLQFGKDRGIDQAEGEIWGENEVELAVVVYLNETAETLAEKAELVIKDLYKFFSMHKSIANGKYSSLNEMENIRNYRIAVTSAYISGANNSTACGIVLKINYTNFID